MKLAIVSIHQQQLFKQPDARSINLALMMLNAMEENVYHMEEDFSIANVTQPIFQLQQNLQHVRMDNFAQKMLIVMEENV